MAALTPGQVGWFDLTVGDAESLRLFYERVVGWTAEPVDMGGYNDHCMKAAGVEQPVSGICHAKGSNATLPPVWIPYITVADLGASLRECTDLGGQIIRPEVDAGSGKFAVIRDPAGAVCALYQVVESGE